MSEDGPSQGNFPARGMTAADWKQIEVRHAIAGRLRLRIPALKGQPDLAGEIQKQLSWLKIVRRVEVSAITGSVLVVYDPADTAAMADLGRMMIPDLDLKGMPAPGDPVSGAPEEPPAELIADYFRELNAKVGEATGSTDLKVLLPASLFVCGLLRLLAAKRVPSPTWYDFLWFAFGTFCTLNRAPRAEPGTGTPMPGLATAPQANGSAL